MPRISSIADMSVPVQNTFALDLHYTATRVIRRNGNLKLARSEFFLELLDLCHNSLGNYRIKFLALFVQQLGSGATLAVQTIKSESAADRAGFALLRRSSVHFCPLFDDVSQHVVRSDIGVICGAAIRINVFFPGCLQNSELRSIQLAANVISTP